MLQQDHRPPEEEFTRWYPKQEAEVPLKGPSLGSKTDGIRQKGALPATRRWNTERGADLQGTVREDGDRIDRGKGKKAVVADEAYIRSSVLDPSADIVAGFPPVMPP